MSETAQYSPAPDTGLEGEQRDVRELRTLVWDLKHQAQSSQANGKVRKSQNLKDFARDEVLLLNGSQFVLYYMEMNRFLRDLMRKNEIFNCCSAQDHIGISREAWERIQHHWLHPHGVFEFPAPFVCPHRGISCQLRILRYPRHPLRMWSTHRRPVPSWVAAGGQESISNGTKNLKGLGPDVSLLWSE